MLTGINIRLGVDEKPNKLAGLGSQVRVQSRLAYRARDRAGLRVGIIPSERGKGVSRLWYHSELQGFRCDIYSPELVLPVSFSGIRVQQIKKEGGRKLICTNFKDSIRFLFGCRFSLRFHPPPFYRRENLRLIDSMQQNILNFFGGVIRGGILPPLHPQTCNARSSTEACHVKFRHPEDTCHT
eukprot:1342984-Amorphochlora_amoeboformis.AAC.1